jgi:hypothetical protein
MPAVAEIFCSRCGAYTEAVAAHGRSTVSPCPCGGVRQVVRIVRHPGGTPPAGPERLERSMRHQADGASIKSSPRTD